MDTVVMGCIIALSVIWIWTLKIVLRTLQKNEPSSDAEAMDLATPAAHVHAVNMRRSHPSAHRSHVLGRSAAPKGGDSEPQKTGIKHTKTGVPLWNIED